MALAFRKSDHPRMIFVALDAKGPWAVPVRLCLIIGVTVYWLEAHPVESGVFAIPSLFLQFEDIIRSSAAEQLNVALSTAQEGEWVVLEPLAFHPSFFVPYVDFARQSDVYLSMGEFERHGRLAVFTHVYDDDAALQVWEQFYAGIVGKEHLFVIDHGSTSPAREVLSPEVNVVRVPRGPVDHRGIAHFCSTFQRFLLAQYRWVLHIDADELVVPSAGWPLLLDRLMARPDQVILRPEFAYDLVHEPDTEAALDLSRPVTAQRRRLVPAPAYSKPVLASVPTTWGMGFHFALEQRSVEADPELWLIHLAHIDLGLHIERGRKWQALEQSVSDRAHVPQANRRVSEENARAHFSALRDQEGGIDVPQWMVGLF